ncbi:hypothetical protein ACE0DR_19120 [Azotobacter sp. CWF10]
MRGLSPVYPRAPSMTASGSVQALPPFYIGLFAGLLAVTYSPAISFRLTSLVL